MAKPKAKKKRKVVKPPIGILGLGLARAAAEKLREKERKRRKALGMD